MQYFVYHSGVDVEDCLLEEFKNLEDARAFIEERLSNCEFEINQFIVIEGKQLTVKEKTRVATIEII